MIYTVHLKEKRKTVFEFELDYLHLGEFFYIGDLKSGQPIILTATMQVRLRYSYSSFIRHHDSVAWR